MGDKEGDDLDYRNVCSTISQPLSEMPIDGGAASRSFPSWMGYIEHSLMNDDDEIGESFADANLQFCSEFFSGILHGSPSGKSVDCLDASAEKCLTASEDNQVVKNSNASQLITESNNNNKNCNADLISIKHRRMLRNRDAALRSRERRKLYVKELEIKTKHVEEECKRLGGLLRWCFGENQYLRLKLHGRSASTSKQESAVLLSESLLLGSLLWLWSIICLCPPPCAHLVLFSSHSIPIPIEAMNVGRGNKKLFVVSEFLGRRCRASKTKMNKSFSLCCPG